MNRSITRVMIRMRCFDTAQYHSNARLHRSFKNQAASKILIPSLGLYQPRPQVSSSGSTMHDIHTHTQSLDLCAVLVMSSAYIHPPFHRPCERRRDVSCASFMVNGWVCFLIPSPSPRFPNTPIRQPVTVPAVRCALI